MPLHFQNMVQKNRDYIFRMYAENSSICVFKKSLSRFLFEQSTNLISRLCSVYNFDKSCKKYYALVSDNIGKMNHKAVTIYLLYRCSFCFVQYPSLSFEQLESIRVLTYLYR